MPLVLDPEALPLDTLTELVRSLRTDLEELRELVDRPRGKVLDPASLETARDLLEATLAAVRPDGPPSAGRLASDANLAYATLVAVVDLVKSHTDVPKVPARR